jgi:tetratricopeptide (TPR) repeat protein
MIVASHKSAILFVVALAAAACQGKEAPKHAFGTAASPGGINVDTSPAARANNPHVMLPPNAKAALDSGNVLYKAGKYQAALAKYELAVKYAPANAAPYYGVYMAADKLGNKKLADSAMAAFSARASNGQDVFNDSMMKKAHTAPPAPKPPST